MVFYGSNNYNYKHGHKLSTQSATRAYSIWQNVKQRCNNANHPAYHHYGGRGIAVCDKWQTFKGFLEDIVALCGSEIIPDNLSIDRIDNDGNYEISNVRLATQQQQCNNKRNNRLITHQGKTQTISQWSKELGLTRTLIRVRIDVLGFTVDEALSPANIRNKSGCVGVTWEESRKQWQAEIRVDNKRHRLGRFKNKEEAIAARKEAEKRLLS